MFKKLNMRGVSHHLLLPVLAILFVAGIGGYIMQRSSSASSITKSCTAITFGRYKNNPANGGKYTKYKPCVRSIQSKVGSGVDGIYGNSTQAHVKTWQKKHGLYADGVVGPKTWAKMGIHQTYKSTTATSSSAASSKTTKTAAQKAADAAAAKKAAALAAAKKDCLSENGAWWNTKAKRCSYPTSFSYCDWGKRSDYGYDMKLTCRTTSVAEGSPRYVALYDKNDSSWNACRSYVKNLHKDANPDEKTINRYCQDRVVKP